MSKPDPVMKPMRPLALLVLFLGAVVTAAALADTAPPVVVKTLVTTTKTDLGQPLVLPKRNPELIVSTFEIAPAARLARHEHPFSRYAYVLQGDLAVQFDDGTQKRYHAGEVIVEAVGTWHFGINTGTQPVRLLVIDLVEAGKPATVLAK
jgi:quercetin dioxygenase-like cupin family protein